MREYDFTIGDGADFSSLYREVVILGDEFPDDETFRNLISSAIGASDTVQRIIAKEPVYRDQYSIFLMVPTGPNGERSADGGVWLNADLMRAWP